MIQPNRSLQSSSSSNSVLTLTTKITASNGGLSNNFGDFNAVAISNNRVVVGASGYNYNTGAAYLFMDPNNPSMGHSYSQMEILMANDGQTGDQFGDSVDIDGDIIVVGAREYNSGGNGAVYIFRIGDNDNISQIAKITAQNGAAGDSFGSSVAIHGNFILVGAFRVAVNGSLDVGSAYLFVNPLNDSNNQQWTQIMQFQPNDLMEEDEFGWSVAMDDQLAVVGTHGNVNNDAAYVFVPVDENVDSLLLWTQMAKLTGQIGSNFGSSVAVAGNSIVVGATKYIKNIGNTVGAVFLFTKIDDSTSSSSTWTEMTVLLAADGSEGDNFGASVVISKDASTIAVGADLDDYYSITYSDMGSVYLFRKSNTETMMMVGWTQVGKYVVADQDTGDRVGSSIAMESSIVVVGAPWDDTASGTDAGSVYVLDMEKLSSLPPDTTATPMAEPVISTFQPTESPATKPNNPRTTNSQTTVAPDSDNSNNPSDSTTKSDNNNIIIAAMVVFGVVVVAFGVVFFNYRLRVKQEDRRQLEQLQQQQQITPPLSSGNNGIAAVNTDEMPITADVIFPVQSTEDRTMPAEVLLDAPQIHVRPAAPAVGNIDVANAGKGLPCYKGQAQTTAPLAGPSHISSLQQNRNSQRNGDQEELPGTLEVQQRQQLRDLPATVNLFPERLPTYKDQVSGE